MQGHARMVLLLAASLLAGCGYHLRNSQEFVFQTLAIAPVPGGAVAPELARYFGDKLVPEVAAPGQRPAQVVLEIPQELRERNVVAVNASGQVRELQLKLRVKFRVRSQLGREIIAATEITQQRDISFNETSALAKEAEEVLLYRDMQADIVQQLLRRLAAIKQVEAP